MALAQRRLSHRRRTNSRGPVRRLGAEATERIIRSSDQVTNEPALLPKNRFDDLLNALERDGK